MLFVIKDRFTNWRRKSEPGFQSYITLSALDNDEEDNDLLQSSTAVTPNTPSTPEKTSVEGSNSTSIETKEIKLTSKPELETPQPLSDEAIVNSILMQSEEFRRRIRLHRRYDSSDDEEGQDSNRNKSRFKRREQCFQRAVNAYNQRSFRSQYDSFKNIDSPLQRQNSSPIVKSTQRKEKLPSDGCKKPNFVTDSKLIKTALRIRESCDSEDETAALAEKREERKADPIYEDPSVLIGKKETEDRSK